ncbi:phosphatidate cytidylyltransferase [Candidatus Vecturithrix granuli]|uniref:Phosphatidate cytidylyltransferase n=1 Tax=Vecturithrix granuli TaxID=1499967 RepID=A0A081BZF1_VECG1|nr:phosphatidate cytidylyltransferase [Candidatus Vecturithrix granuli]
MHRTRVITSIVGLVVLLSLIGWGNPLIFWVAISSATVIGLIEFYKIIQARELPVYFYPGVFLGWLFSLAALVSSLFTVSSLTDFTLTLIVVAIFLYALLSRQTLSECIPALALTVFGIFYVAWLFNHLTFLRVLPHGKRFVFYLLLIVWSGDTGAYYTGSFFGKHKLAPLISPKKTIEGALGGTAASLIASIIAKLTFLPLLSYAHALILALLMAIMAQLGDLCESMLKRAANVKDSGTLLPGHGGILDRVDGVMFAAPVLYYYAVLFLLA